MYTVEEMRAKGYPLRIAGNEGIHATLVDCQPLFAGEFLGIYRYPGGECCHSLSEIRSCFEVIEK